MNQIQAIRRNHNKRLRETIIRENDKAQKGFAKLRRMREEYPELTLTGHWNEPQEQTNDK